MKHYRVQITDNALSDMEGIYHYIAGQLQAPEAAMEQYNRISDAIETLDVYPERVKLLEIEELHSLGLRQLCVDNFSVFFHIRDGRVIITNVELAIEQSDFHDKPAALAQFTLHLDGAMMGCHDPLAEGQPQAEPAVRIL